jgi:hypothetical protein
MRTRVSDDIGSASSNGSGGNMKSVKQLLSSVIVATIFFGILASWSVSASDSGGNMREAVFKDKR